MMQVATYLLLIISVIFDVFPFLFAVNGSISHPLGHGVLNDIVVLFGY